MRFGKVFTPNPPCFSPGTALWGAPRSTVTAKSLFTPLRYGRNAKLSVCPSYRRPPLPRKFRRLAATSDDHSHAAHSVAPHSRTAGIGGSTRCFEATITRRRTRCSVMCYVFHHPGITHGAIVGQKGQFLHCIGNGKTSDQFTVRTLLFLCYPTAVTCHTQGSHC